ncbi:hypothetical protein GCM10009849_29110 [Sinomonas flava]|uniref:Uncharacterized protein n=1 Tax=Sinomonas flava TaxID=496857 RepID=A0ABP5NR79_9MICC
MRPTRGRRPLCETPGDGGDAPKAPSPLQDVPGRAGRRLRCTKASPDTRVPESPGRAARRLTRTTAGRPR